MFAVAIDLSCHRRRGTPLVGGRLPLLRTPPPRSDTALPDFFEDFWYAGRQRSRSQLGPDRW
jgi:hypothetical protein